MRINTLNLAFISTVNTVTKQTIRSDILQSNYSLRLNNTIWNSILYAIVLYNVIVLYIVINSVSPKPHSLFPPIPQETVLLVLELTLSLHTFSLPMQLNLAGHTIALEQETMTPPRPILPRVLLSSHQSRLGSRVAT